MRWFCLLLFAILTSATLAQVVMPPSLYRDLDAGNGRHAFAQLKRHPEWVNSREGDLRQTPLHVAAVRGHTEIVRWLIARGADVNARCYNDFSPLLLAANGQIATMLLKAGAKTNVHSAFGETPMQFAASDGANGQKRRLEVVEAIHRSGVPYDLTTAATLGRRDLVAAILKAHPESVRYPGPGDRTPLHWAARTGDIALAKLLLDAGAEIDAGPEPRMNFGSGKFTPLCDALWNGKADMIEFLCERGANPNKMGEQLRRALLSSTPRIIAILKKYSSLRPKDPPGDSRDIEHS